MKTRFDLEQEIMQCWNVVDDLKMLKDRDQLTSENIGAITALYNVKFETLFETFEDCIKTEFYKPDADVAGLNKEAIASVADLSEN